MAQQYFTGSIPLIMLSTYIYADSSRATRWTATDMRIDPANYTKKDGSTAIVAAWFEAKIEDPRSGGHLGPDVLELLDETDTVRATITTDGVPGEGSVRYRVSMNIDLTQARTYRIRTGVANYYLNTNDVMIVLDVENAYRVKVMAGFLVAGDESTGSAGSEDTEALDNLDVWCMISSDLTYIAGSIDYAGQDHWVGKFLKDASKFATIESWEFEVIASQFLYLGTGGDASQNGFAALFNATSGLMVAGTELTFPPGQSRQSATFLDGATNFSDLAEFEPRFKVENTDESIGVTRAIVYVQLTAATKAQYIAGRAINGNHIPYANAEIDTEGGRYYHDASKFPVDTKFFYEMTGNQGTTLVPVSQLNDAGTSDWGFQSAIASPAAAAIISGAWSNPSNAADDGLEGGPLASTSALLESIVSGEIAQLQLSDFPFTPSIPPGVTIELVNVFLRYVLEGQTASLAVSVNGNSFHSYFSAVGLGFTQQQMFDATFDTGWAPGDFGTPTVDIKVTHPANITDTKWWINGLTLVVGWSDLLVESILSFTATPRVRVRSGELTLIDAHRYTVVHPGSSAGGGNRLLHSSGLILAEVSIPITPDPPSIISTCPLPEAQVGVPYSFQLEAMDGSGDYLWSVIYGTLPAGLSLSSGGLISGTPTEAGTISVILKVENA